MEEKAKEPLHYKRVKDICVDMYTQDETIERRLVAGRALLNSEKGEFVFAQNAPRGPKSTEVGRTAHARFVRRPDGFYTVTFRRMHPAERNLREQLLAEVRQICDMLKEDYETEERKRRAAMKEVKKAAEEAEKEGGKDE